MVRVEERYASALLAALQSPQLADEAGTILAEYAACMADNTEFRSFISSPVVPKAVRKETLEKMVEGGLPQLVHNFLFLLVDKGRIELLPEISKAYQLQKAALRNTLVISVHSAYALSEEEQDSICKHFAKKYDAADTILKMKVNPRLLGGVRVHVGDMLYDGTLFGKMERLRREIKKLC